MTLIFAVRSERYGKFNFLTADLCVEKPQIFMILIGFLIFTCFKTLISPHRNKYVHCLQFFAEFGNGCNKFGQQNDLVHQIPA
jgi:hypothetical protein